MARSFNGTTDKADTGAVATVATSNVAICCWVMRTATATSKTIFINGSTGANGFAIGTDGSGNFTKVIGGVSTTSLGVVPALNNWYHVLVQRDATTLNGYINGVLSGSGVTSAPVAATVKTSMGYDGGTASFFPGVIMDCAIWNGPLSPAQISALANGVRPGSVSALGALDYLSISRSSIGYAKTSAGTLKWFPANTLRITDLGLLIEDARKNIVKSSQDVTNLSLGWFNSGVTLTANSTTAPNGTVTADSVITTASGGEHYARIGTDNVDNFTAGTLACWSAYFKPAGYNFALLLVYDVTAGNFYYVKVNLLTAAVSTITGAGTPANVTIGSEALANGWVRAWGTMTVGANPLTLGLQVSDGGSTVTFTADGVSGIYVWGAQIEAGAFPSSYIPTESTSVTRAQDVVTAVGSLATVLAGIPMSCVINAIMPNFDGVISPGQSYLIRNNDGLGTANNLNFPNNPQTIRWGETGQAANLDHDFSSTGLSIKTGVKVGFGQDGSGRSLVGGGATVTSDAFSLTMASPQQLGYTAGGSPFQAFGYYRRLTAWNSRLANATLQSLTDPNITSGFPSAGATIDIDFTTSRYYSSLEALAPVGWWPFDGYASPEPDLSSGSHNATLTGTARVLGPGIVARATGS